MSVALFENLAMWLLSWMILLLFPLLPLLCVAIPISFASSWRWLIGAAVLIGGLLAFFWIDYALNARSAPPPEGIFDRYAPFLLQAFTIAFLALLFARICGLWLQARGYRRRHVLPTDMLAVLATLLIHWSQWKLVLA